MLKKLILSIALLINLQFSCEDESILPDDKFTVVVQVTADISCGLPVISFLDDISRVKERTSLETLTYFAYHLDPSLNVVGTKLSIEFTEVRPEDLRVCKAIGIWYPGISIVEAKLAD